MLILDGRQVLGIATFNSGQPSGVGFTPTDGADLGGDDGACISVTGKAPRQYGDRTFQQFFNTTVISFFKLFPIGTGKRNLQLRGEMNNAFNHT